MTVDRKTKCALRVPALVFINKMDAPARNAFRGIEMLRDKLGFERRAREHADRRRRQFAGVVDLITLESDSLRRRQRHHPRIEKCLRNLDKARNTATS